MQIESDQLDLKLREMASLLLEDKPFSENSGQTAAEQDFCILGDGDLEDLYNFVCVLESLDDDLEAAVKGSSSSERVAENEVSLLECKNWTAHVSLDRKNLSMTHDIIQDGINNSQDNKEEFNDKFQLHPIACIESVPGKENANDKCNLCDETFSSKLSYQTHIRSFHCKKDHKCLNCKKTFHWSIDLERHLRTHTGERPFKCSFCEKTFTQRGNMNLHIRTHTGERPYKCSLCEKTFTRRGNMKLHIRTHTGERPYKCSLCEKTFTRRGNMKLHIRTHTVERPFKCTLCEKTFSLRGHMS